MKKILRDEEVIKLFYDIDMNEGFVNFGAMANPEYNKLVPEHKKLIRKVRRENTKVQTNAHRSS